MLDRDSLWGNMDFYKQDVVGKALKRHEKYDFKTPVRHICVYFYIISKKTVSSGRIICLIF